MNSKKNLASQKGHKALIAVVLSCVLVAATGTWAWKSFQSLQAENNLQLAGSYDVELHDLYGGEEQISKSSELANGGAQPTPVSINGSLNHAEEKRIWMTNPLSSQAPVFVRLKLTESLVGGDAEYDGSFITFKGTTAADVVNSALIGWTFGSSIQDITTWNGTDHGDFWLMDTDTGYAYWMNPLYPGHSTDDFLTSIMGMQANENPLNYKIQVVADAISATVATDRTQWGASSNNAKLDQLFALYQDLANPAKVIFDDIEGVGSTDFAAAFPDSAMQTFVQTVVDINGDGDITQAELNTVTIISNGEGTDLPANFVGAPTTVQGIEYFPYLETLFFFQSNSIIGVVDLSMNPCLYQVSLAYNGITELNASNNPNLVFLAAQGNFIADVQLPQGNNTLVELLLAGNPTLTSLDLSNTPNVYRLRLGDCNITSLDISDTLVGSNALYPIDGGTFVGNGMTSITISQAQNTPEIISALQNSSGNALNAPGAIIVIGNE